MSGIERSGRRVVLLTSDRATMEELQEILSGNAELIRMDLPAGGGQGLEKLVTFDGVFLDTDRTEQDGDTPFALGLLGRMLELNSSLPVVLLSSQNDADLAVRSLKLGARDFIVKPLLKEKHGAAITRLFCNKDDGRIDAMLQPNQDLLRSNPGPSLIPIESFNLAEVERTVIAQAIRKHSGNISRAAGELGLTRTSLYRRIEKYGL